MTADLTERSRQLLDAWLGWRGGATLPCRGDFRIEDIIELLPGITLLEAFSPEEFRFRLAGTSIDQYSGLKLTGTNPLSVTLPEHRELRAKRIWNMANTPCGALLRFRHRYPNSYAELPMEALNLPVRSEDPSGPVQIFTVFSSDRPEREVEPPQNQLATTLPDEFHYVDLGAGAPEDGTGPMIALESLLTD